MPRFMLTYDMRWPSFASTPLAAQYGAMLDQAAYADLHGFSSVNFNEHHASPDGYLPSPVAATAAVAARTKTVALRPLIITPFQHPLKLAEDLAVVDLISGGRLEPVLGAGYRATEFEMFGVDPRERRGRLVETIEVLRRAWTGEPFEYEGRTVRVTPKPARDGGPPILLGGMSRAAARLAARSGDGFFPVGTVWWDAYREECVAVGKPDPGPPPHGGPMFVHVAEDPERDWHQLTPYLMAGIDHYRNWAIEDGARLGEMPPQFRIMNEEELRESSHFQVVTPDGAVRLLAGLGPDDVFMARPMWGGHDPDVAWTSLELLVERVMPALARESASG